MVLCSMELPLPYAYEVTPADCSHNLRGREGKARISLSSSKLRPFSHHLQKASAPPSRTAVSPLHSQSPKVKRLVLLALRKHSSLKHKMKSQLPVLLLNISVILATAKRSHHHRKGAPPSNVGNRQRPHVIWPWDHTKKQTKTHQRKRVAVVWSKVVFSQGEFNYDSYYNSNMLCH